MNKLEVKEKLKDNKLPEGWVKIRLGEIIIENIKSRFKVENADNSGRYPFFTSGEAILSDSNYLIDYENVFLATGGVANIKYYKGKANYSADTYCLKAKITTKYLYYFLLKNLMKVDYKYFSGSGLKHLQKSDFKKEILILPSLPCEQQKIAEILETVDETIEKTDAIIEKCKRIKQGLMQDLLNRGITAFEFEKDKLIAAVKKVFDSGDHRFGREENLVNHLSRHLNELFLGWNVDSEVEKNNKRQRPDIIIHKRKMNENLFAIEVKKNENLNAIKKDIEKLEDVMLGDYHYEDAVFIGFDIENFRDIFEFSDRANFILVSKNGEIKVKSRVRKLRDSLLGRIPEEWEGVSVCEIVNVISGGTPNTSRPEYWNGNIPWLSVEDFNSGKRWVFSGVKYITELGLKRSATRVLKKGILIISARGTVGIVAQLGRSMAFNQSSYGLDSKNKKRLSNDFLYYALKFYINLFLALAYGNVFDTITRKNFKEIKILLPPLLEQHRIASILSQIDETIEEEQNYKEKLERLKQGLMEDLLTGEVRVNHLIKEGVEIV